MSSITTSRSTGRAPGTTAARANPGSRVPMASTSATNKPMAINKATSSIPTKRPTAPVKVRPSTISTTPATSKQENWISQAVQNKIASAGNYAGGFVTAIGDSINQAGQGIGNSITNTTGRWGRGVADYGNGIKDSVGVGGPRVATGTNPLGIAGHSTRKVTGGLPGGTSLGGAVTKKGTASNPLGL